MRARLLVAALVAVVVCASSAAPAEAKPEIDRTCNGTQTCDAWFTSPVSVKWTISAAWVSSGCQNETITQDTPGTPRGCIVTDGTESASRDVKIKLDQTPPIISGAVPDRPPDHSGWYSHPVTFVVQGDDATSTLAGCDAPSYAGPDAADAAIVATCRDKAGNAASRAFPLRYDATPPDPSGATAETGDRVVRLAWPAGATATVARTPGTRGASSVLYEGRGAGVADRQVRNGRHYRYTVTLTDEAGNVASRDLTATPGPHLLSPGRDAQVAGPPVLHWTPVRGARYYNVQLFRGGRKLLSAWPVRPSLRLRPTWRFDGRRHRLGGGPLRWYVWPGRGPRALRRYGPLIGTRRFTVAAAQAGRRN